MCFDKAFLADPGVVVIRIIQLSNVIEQPFHDQVCCSSAVRVVFKIFFILRKTMLFLSLFYYNVKRKRLTLFSALASS